MITAEQIKQLSTAEKLEVMETLWRFKPKHRQAFKSAKYLNSLDVLYHD